METLGGGIENSTENCNRSSRRIKYSNINNKSINSKLNESKDQENVNNPILMQNEADTSKRDETSKNYSPDAPIANLNSSTPRRKKDPLSNLYSNLSPKYIGFTTAPTELNNSKEERTRNLRSRHNNRLQSADAAVDKDKESDILLCATFTPSNDSTVGFVRRTPRNRDFPLTPGNSTKRKKFVSPIDKLLIKNGAVMENNSNLLLEGNNEVNMNYKEVTQDYGMVGNNKKFKKHIEVEELEEFGIKDLEDHDETTEQRKKEENCDETNEEEKDEENVSISTEIAIRLEDSQSEAEEDNLSLEENKEVEINNADFYELKNENEVKLEKKIEEKKFEKTEFKEKEDPSISENSDQKNIENLYDVQKTNNLLPEEENSIHNESENEENIHPASPETVVKQNKVPLKIELESVETENSNDFVVDAEVSANSPSAVSMDSAKGSSIINEGYWMSYSTGDLYWGQIYSYCYWPCMVCPDPDGKTITTEEVGRSGDQSLLVHVRFFADNGRRNWVKRENLLAYNGIENYQERVDEMREKYGTKSAKYRLYVPIKRKEHVWYEAVNEANIVAEVAYADRLEKFYEIFEKSKAFHKLEKQRRKSMYISVNSGSTSDIESFYGSNDNVNSLSLATVIKQKRERSVSPYSPAYSPIKSVAAKRRKLSGEQKSVATTNEPKSVQKNEENPNSTDLNLSQTNSVGSISSSSLNNGTFFNNIEFQSFFAIMKDYIMEENDNENLEKSLLAATHNIWAIKHVSHGQMECKLKQTVTENDTSHNLALSSARPTKEASIKRLSSRLKTLRVRKSLLAQQTSESEHDRSVTPKPSKEVPSVKKPLNRPILEVVDDIFELDNKYLFKGMTRDPVCKYCFKPGGNLRKCAKQCSYWLHIECLNIDFSESNKVLRAAKAINGTPKSSSSETLNENHSISTTNINEVDILTHVTGDSEMAITEIICKECAKNEPSKCMVCQCTESKKEGDPLVKCSMAQCERGFHPGCCKYWPQAKITISKNHIESFRCPSHVCHTCVSDDPKGKFQHLSNSKLTKCVKCPATFHTDSTCIPAGTQILTSAHIICPRHTSKKHDLTVNVNWCFICVGGGQLMCCETCPTAVHAQCLKIPIAANEGYICEECESGRMPLYGEMVWAKFNNFRWWPAIILPPTEIPRNIARKPHNPADFVVRFFGTHDHGWISRRRVYLYLEGDSSEPPKTKSSLDVSYNKGIEEAKEVCEIVKTKKLQQRNSNEDKEKLHPQPYVRIKANRAVPPVKLHVDIESVSKCECDPREENPCGPDTNCLNRVLYHECNPKLCPAGERCQNQMFESRVSPRLDVVYMKERGFGLLCREPIQAGTFVIEYVGEIINDDEFQARMQQKSRDRDENFYFLSVEKDYIIDAGPKGNLARFMNHSCDPNCETQKWLVNSINRVGLFAIKNIPANTELTFNYHWDDLLGNEKKTCYCGAKKCAGQIGGKIKDMETVKEPTVINQSSNNKSKTKPVKRLLNGAIKHKRGPKPKSNVQTKIKTKKKAAAVAVSALFNADDKSITIKSENIKEEPKENEELSPSRTLVSPDIFC